MVIVAWKDFVNWLGAHVKKLNLVSFISTAPHAAKQSRQTKHKGHFQPPDSEVLPDRLVFTLSS